MSTRLDEIHREARAGKISWGGAGELASAEVQWWREAEIGSRRGIGLSGFALLLVEFAFLPTRVAVREIGPDHYSVRIESAIGWTMIVAFVAFAWFLMVGFFWPGRLGLGVLLGWFSVQAAYLAMVGVRRFWRGPHGAELGRRDYRTRCGRCHYSLSGLPEAFDAAREIGPDRCVECGHPWPRLA